MRAAFNVRSDGSIEAGESRPVLRAACVVLAPMIVAAVGFAQWVEGAWRLGPLLGAAAGALALLLLAGLLEDLAFHFDARERSLTWRSRRWLRRRAGVVRFDDIRSVAVIRTTSRDGDTVRPRESFTAWLSTDQARLRLPGAESPDRAELDAMVAAIRRLLDARTGPPDDETSVRDMLRAGRLIDAIGHLRATRGLSLEEATARVRRLGREGDR